MTWTITKVEAGDFTYRFDGELHFYLSKDIEATKAHILEHDPAATFVENPFIEK